MKRILIALGLCFIPMTASVGEDAKTSKLLFVSNRTGNYDIFLINADGSDPKNLTDNPAMDTDPAWSPDGKKIAFASDRNGDFAIFIMDADGGNVVQVTKEANSGDRMPTWSPDGKRIAFRRSIATDSDIYVMNSDGTGQTNLTNALSRNSDPAWSPDGKKIAFATQRNGKGYSVYVMDPDGSNLQDVSQSDSRRGYIFPAWSPDSKLIAFGEQVGNGVEIFVCSLDGSTNKQLTKEGDLNTNPSWSPDGKRIAFHHFRPTDMGASLTIMDANGDNLKEILMGEVPIRGARSAWKPK